MRNNWNRLLHETISLVAPKSRLKHPHGAHFFYHSIREKPFHPYLSGAPVRPDMFIKHLKYLKKITKIRKSVQLKGKRRLKRRIKIN